MSLAKNESGDDVSLQDWVKDAPRLLLEVETSLI